MYQLLKRWEDHRRYPTTEEPEGEEDFRLAILAVKPFEDSSNSWAKTFIEYFLFILLLLFFVEMGTFALSVSLFWAYDALSGLAVPSLLFFVHQETLFAAINSFFSKIETAEFAEALSLFLDATVHGHGAELWCPDYEAVYVLLIPFLLHPNFL